MAEGQRMDTLSEDSEEFKEWDALLAAAKLITADSSLTTVVWKVCKFFFDEGNPLVLVYVLMNISGEVNWIYLFLPLIINLVVCLVVGYYLSNEKREVCASKQGENCSSLMYDMLRKTFSLMFDWISEVSREKKRKKRIHIIERNVYRNARSGPWKIEKKAFLELTKFYSSHLRYLREDLLVTTLRSFFLVVLVIYKIANPESMALYLCKVSDCLKFGYVIWIIWKTSSLIKSYQEAERMYIATVQLWGASWTKNAPGCSVTVKILQYYEINQKLEEEPWFVRWPMRILDTPIHLIFMAIRFLTATLCMLIGYPYPLGFVVWYCFLMAINVGLLDAHNYFGVVRLRSIFDNPPTGYSRKRHKWIDRFMSVIFYSYGYSRKGLRGVLNWKAVLILPSVFAYFVILVVRTKGTLDLTFLTVRNTNFMHTSLISQAILYGNVTIPNVENNDYQCSMGSTSFLDRTSETEMTILKCVQSELRSNPLNIMDYLGGINYSVYVILSLWIIGWILESAQQVLQQRIGINLDKFELYPFLDSIHCYRSLVKGALTKTSIPRQERISPHNHENNNNDRGVELELQRLTEAPQQDIVVAVDNYVWRLMALTVLDSTQFSIIWSEYNTSAKVFPDTLTEQMINLDSSLSHNVNQEDVSFTESWGEVTLEKLLIEAENRIVSLRRWDHPLEPNNVINTANDSNFISSIFRSIQQQTMNLVTKRKNVKLFILFCVLLNQRLSEMSSFRIERTFEMLQIEISKTYEGDDDTQ